MPKLSLRAPAKINLTLQVLGRFENGYHNLRMIMAPLSLSDEITLESIPHGIEFFLNFFPPLTGGKKGEGEHFTFPPSPHPAIIMAGRPSPLKGEGEDVGLTSKEKNLAVRAAKVLLETSGIKSGVRISLTKKIPVAAGLGGGSSDAAAVLRGLNTLWNVNYTSQRLADIGVKLGADVPFFCFDGPAYVEGIGEKITPISSFPKLFLLLINPSFPVSTKWVFEEYGKRFLPSKQLTANEPSASFRQHFQGVGDVVEVLRNDLEQVTMKAFPELQTIKTFLIQQGALGTLMSGSGPTMFGIFQDAATRNTAATMITNKNWQAFAVESV